MNMARPPTTSGTDPLTTMRRMFIIILAFTGLLVTTYLALYQWRIISDVWDPLFGNDSAAVLTSLRRIPAEAGHISLPVTAILAGDYVLILVLGILVHRSWIPSKLVITIFFDLAVVASALANLTLLLSQPTIFFGWCTLCLLSVAIAIAILLLAIPDLRAGARFLIERHLL